MVVTPPWARAEPAKDSNDAITDFRSTTIRTNYEVLLRWVRHTEAVRQVLKYVLGRFSDGGGNCRRRQSLGTFEVKFRRCFEHLDNGNAIQMKQARNISSRHIACGA